MTIEVKDVKKSYDGKVVLEDFSLNIESEHSYIITGPSGCGKTTLLRLILGLEKPDAGTVKLLGDYKYPFINSGTVFQEDRLCEEYDAVTNVTMVSRKVFRETVTEELLQLLPEEDPRYRSPLQDNSLLPYITWNTPLKQTAAFVLHPKVQRHPYPQK